MAQQLLDIGTVANDGTGDTLRNAMDKVNDNFTDLYTNTNVGSTVVITSNTISTTNTNEDLVLNPAGTGAVSVIGNLGASGDITAVTLTTTGTIDNGRLLLSENIISSTDSNEDIVLDPNGTGTIDVTLTANSAGTPANFSAAEYITIKVGGVTKYIPLATSTW